MDLIFKILGFLIISNSCLHVECADCTNTISNNTSVFQFKNETESYMRDCLINSKYLVKSLTIDSFYLKNIKNVLTNNIVISKLETLIVTNGNISIFDLSNLALPSLKTLSLTKNKIESFLFPFSPLLEILNVSYNDIKEWNSSNYLNLFTLDLSHNNLINFNIMTSSLKFLYMSNAFSINISSKSFRSSNLVEFVDLSGNYITEISFLSVYKLRKLDVSFNKLSSLESIESSTKSFVDLTLNLSENPLQCSMNITKDWLNMKMRNTLFTEELQCVFESSSKKYSIRKFGWMFDSEVTMFNSIWKETLLGIYEDTKSIKFSSFILSNGVKVGWTLKNRITYKVFVLFLSVQKREIFSKDLQMTNDQMFDILFANASEVNETCFLVNTPKQETTGITNINVTINCQNSLPFNSSKTLYPLGYIIAVIILVILLVVLLLLGVLFYLKTIRPLRTHRPSNSISLEQIQKNRAPIIKSNRETLSGVNCNPAFDSSPEVIPRNTLRVLNESRISSNIYETMEGRKSFKNDQNIYDSI